MCQTDETNHAGFGTNITYLTLGTQRPYSYHKTHCNFLRSKRMRTSLFSLVLELEQTTAAQPIKIALAITLQ